MFSLLLEIVILIIKLAY